MNLGGSHTHPTQPPLKQLQKISSAVAFQMVSDKDWLISGENSEISLINIDSTWVTYLQAIFFICDDKQCPEVLSAQFSLPP